MSAAAIVNESVLLPDGALRPIKLTLEKHYAHAKFHQYIMAIHNHTSYSIAE